MAFVTTWNRLEPLPRHKDLRDGLEARLADPLWLLGRQWQFGEFQGSDGGRPVLATFEADRADLSRYQPRGGGNVPSEPYEPLAEPLEVRVEAEARAGGLGHCFWLSQGTRLQKLLRARNVSGVTLRRLRQEYPVDPNTIVAPGSQPDPQMTKALALLSLAGGKAIDAEKYHADASISLGGAAPSLPAALAQLPRTEADKVKAATIDWLEGLHLPLQANRSAWQDDQLEYSFATATDLNGEVALEASEYSGGRLDWYAFDARRDLSLGAPPGGMRHVTRTALPVPVAYAGMPADRFWEYEDHPVRFGEIATSGTDLARLLMSEFALIYGNDWFLLPVDLSIGSLLGNAKVTVTDTFGATVAIKQELHPETTLFELSSNKPNASGLFLLAPALSDADIGEPDETVMIIRDELANIVWGIEKRVPDGLGGSRDRSEDPAGVPGSNAIQNMPPDAELIYRLNSTVPANWIPYVPIETTASTARKTMLEQRVIESVRVDGSRSKAPPEGVILTESKRIELEEITREGVVLDRQKHLTRWTDGRYHFWIGRRKRVGRGEGSSGLRYDFTEEV